MSPTMKTQYTLPRLVCIFATLLLGTTGVRTAELKDVSVSGGVEQGKARLIIEGWLNGTAGDQQKSAFTVRLEHSIRIERERLNASILARIDVLTGTAAEFPLAIIGEGEIRNVTGEGLQDWSIRQETNGTRTLVLRPRAPARDTNSFAFKISAEQELRSLPATIHPLALTAPRHGLFSGFISIITAAGLAARAETMSGLIEIEPKYLPEGMRSEMKTGEAPPLAFRFEGTAIELTLNINFADPEARLVTLRNFNLTGELGEDTAAFQLTATAKIKDPKGGTLDILSGAVGMTELPDRADWRLHYDQGKFILAFDHAGEFPIELKFNAKVEQSPDGTRKTTDFQVAPSPLQPLVIRGLPAETQFEFPAAARPERKGDEFRSYLPADGKVKLSWKLSKAESEGKLFYSAEMLEQISVSPGLMRQVALLDLKVTQGELNRLSLLVRGSGEVTRIQGENVLAWNFEPVPGSQDRRLVVQFNQALKDRVSLQVHLQSPLGAFPQAVDAMQLRPDGATRFAGYIRIVNEGAVRLEVVQSTGVTQVSPDQFPETDTSRAALRVPGSQRFAYRFSGGDVALRIQADQIQPELAVSEMLVYRLGENEMVIDTEIEIEIREAPVRELTLHVPKGFAIARLNVPGMNDYFLREPEDQPDGELRLVFGQPVSGRQVLLLRLERNKALSESSWTLPRVEVAKAKSVRGHIAASADPGYRLSVTRIQALTEIATALFPRKVPGIQLAFRLSEPSWAASLRVERLPQTVQVDGLHLFSIREGIAYGSSVLNFAISGAPVSSFRLELSDEYYNVEFTGKDIRNWQKTTNGFVVQLHSPVSGVYTLLATYERPFKAQGETLTFTGARPLDAQSDQGHTLIISAYQFQVKPVDVSPGLLPLETREVPSEYRLFFDAPILAAYRYNSRPFNLKLALSPLTQGESLGQVVDRAALVTRISKEGQVVTDVRYYLKNRGQPNLRLILPAETQLWNTTVNGTVVVPVLDGATNLIPLPQTPDPNAVLTVDLKLASRAKEPSRVRVVAPSLGAPVMLSDWKLDPDTGQRLVYRAGSLTPAGGVADNSGFAALGRLFRWDPITAGVLILCSLLLIWAGLAASRWGTRPSVYRRSLPHITAVVIALATFALAIVLWVGLAQLAHDQGRDLPRNISLLAPIQQSGSTLFVDLSNVADKFSFPDFIGYVWPVLIAVAVWVYGWLSGRPFSRTLGWIGGCAFLAWAALRTPNGARAFIAVLLVFAILELFLPALRALLRVPRPPQLPPPAPTQSAAAAAAALAIAGLLSLCLAGTAGAAPAAPRSKRVTTSAATGDSKGSASSKSPVLERPVAERLVQTMRIDDNFAFGTAKLHWEADKGQLLPLVFEPAVLTSIKYPTNSLKLVQGTAGGKRVQQLMAETSGAYEIELTYELQVVKKETESGVTLPVEHGLVNELALTVLNSDVDILSPQAVAIQRDLAGSNTVARLVLTPVNDAWVAWKPRSRDVKHEKPVFYAELAQLYAPAAGLIEGACQVSIRPAQGELGELIFEVPAGATITDVLDASKTAVPADGKPAASSLVSLWRFDPDTRKLRVTISQAQSRPFALLIRSQIATGRLPFEHSVGLLKVDTAAGQIGLFAVATGNEVQLDSVNAVGLSPINLEDFPSELAAALLPQMPGLTVRRAFRYSDPAATLSMTASAVQPDVRVESQDTISIGEDRTLLAANPTVEITRAGIFRLSFLMPTGFDVETVSGSALSHWTELKTDEGRVITLHLTGKTQGKQQFAISLAGPGLKATNNWAVPQLVLREAGKQSGSVLLVPEQGLRLQVVNSEGLTQLDPQKAGIKQKGVLAFRLLQTSRSLTLNVEQVEAWVQVTSLQHLTLGEAQAKVIANLQFQIENTGLKTIHVLVPTNAESVRFSGDQVADFLPAPGAITNGLQTWEIKLHRRVIGSWMLQAAWQTALPDQASAFRMRGIQATDVNMQRGFVTIQSAGRLQVRIDAPPEALQPAEWQSIPRLLQQGLPAQAANFTYRLVEADFSLPIALERHQPAKLLPARINSITFTSVISDDGNMLTHAQLEMLPGDKRLLQVTLPTGGRFWFAFVNQNGVWPWREQDRILIPLEKQSRSGAAVPVEIFFTSRAGDTRTRSLDLNLLAPKFDLPLENITWRVLLNEKWQVRKWSGSLQFQQEQVVPQYAAANLENYLQKEVTQQRERTREAEQLMAAANSALQQGDPQQARRDFQAAYGLSTHDAAFNEDARVQLHNIKLQQALVGLNVRQASVAGEASPLAGKLRDLRARKEANYSQQDAKEIIDRNTDDENAAFMRLAERLIQQQEAAKSSPSALRANVPDQGRSLTFKRAVAVDPWADLQIHLRASAVRPASWGFRVLVVLATFTFLAVLAWAARSLRQPIRQS
jgi:hypothetical protein